MQLIESALALFIIIQLIFLFITKKNKQILAFIGMGLLAFHLILGEARWQMVLIYLIETILILIFLKGITAKKWLRIVGCIFALLFTITSAILSYSLPVFSLPETTGAYQVGLHRLHIKLKSRDELITTDPSDKRELMVNIWYPTDENIDSREDYLPQVEREGFALKYGLPAEAFSYLSKVRTHHQLDVRPAKGQFPVLIFSPGYFTPGSGYLSVIEELVSYGFVVFNLIPPHETIGVEYPDRRKVLFNLAFSESNSWNWNDEVAEAMSIFYNTDIDSIARKAAETIVETYGADIVKRWALDITDLIDLLPEYNNDPTFPLNGLLNLNQLATYGHSMGGAAAMEAAIFDDRIKASVNLDGTQWGQLMTHSITKSSALLSSSATVSNPDPNQYVFEESRGSDFYDLVLRNSGHSNFSDIPFMINQSQLNEAGSISPILATQTINQFILNFFRKYLMNEKVDLDEFIQKNQHLNVRE